MTQPDSLARAGRTEALFREVNDRIAESAARLEADETAFLCECSDPSCTDRFESTLTGYERVRWDETTFLVLDGHQDDRIEQTVESRGGLAVVEKTDPRIRELVRRPRTG